MKNDFITLTTKYTKNLGDEIQIIAAERFTKGRTTGGTVDRERLSAYDGEPARVIMNGWYFHDTSYWPPSDKLTPLVTSFHLTDLDSEIDGRNPRDVVLENDNLSFFMRNAPFGARDLEVYQFMQRHGVPSYFSGCMTLTLEAKGLEKNGTILCVDVEDSVLDFIRSKTDKKVVNVHNSEFPETSTYDEKMQLARDRLDAYEQADLVISRRLHSVLPSVALGTPVIMLHNKSVDNSRYLGLKDLLRNCTQEEFLAGLYNEQLQTPEPNREYYKVIRQNLEKIVTNFVNGTQLSHDECLKISEQNLQTILLAKEENEQFIHGFADQLIDFKRTSESTPPKRTALQRIRGKAKAILKS